MAGRGNPNPKGSKPDKLMRDALMVALNREAVGADGQPTKRLYIIAENLAKLAEQGDKDALGAIREVFDRVDGKVPQALELSGEVDHGYVARMPQPSADMDTWQSQFGTPPTTVQ